MNSDKSLPSDEKPSVKATEESSAAQTVALGPQATPEPSPGVVVSPPVWSTSAEPVTVAEVRQYGESLDGFGLPGYEILGEVGHGGMGVVYKALQLSLDRVVALKCLPPSLRTDPDRLRQFRIEARAAAQLTKHGVLPVYDVIQTTGTPVLVMPYIAGSDLAHIITDRIAGREHPESDAGTGGWGSLPEAAYLDKVLGLMDRIIEALVHLHRADVLHRDIKPSNILVDEQGDGWLADFGLAQLGMQNAPGLVTQSVGTPGYMSPEQWDGVADLDGRADVFSLAVTIYQALALERPYGRNRLTVATPPPVPLSQLNPLVLDELSSVVMQGLQPDRDRRPTAAEFRDAWNRARRSTGAVREPPPPRRLAAAVGVLLAAGILGLIAAASQSGSKESPSAIPAVETATVFITTEPAGARIVFVPLHPDTGEPVPERAIRSRPGQTTPMKLNLPPGQYIVEVDIGGGTPIHRFHQVYRQVPEPGQAPSSAVSPYNPWKWRDDGTAELRIIKLPANDVIAKMARFQGAPDFILGAKVPAEASPPHMHPVKPFFLDTHEVTEDEFRATHEGLLPVMLSNPRGGNLAVTNVTYIEAMHCAEMMGKRLPTEEEYEFAATRGGTRKFPWGDDKKPLLPWTFFAVGKPEFDRTPTEPPVTGLYSNVAEWTSTWHMPYSSDFPVVIPDYRTTRVVRGAPRWVVMGEKPHEGEDPLTGPRYRMGLSINKAYPTLSFRCARSVQPRFLNP
jgi:serine/threonine protein kinase